LQESTEDAELTHLQFHQVQEELERYILKSNQLELQLKEREESVRNLQKDLLGSTDEQQRLAEQSEQLKRELQESTEDAELTLLQLHQVQEELERYFLKSNQLELQLKEREESVRELGLQLKQQRQDAARDVELQVKQLRDDYESQLSRNNTTLTSLVTQRDRLLSIVRSQSRLIHRFMAVCSRISPSFLVFARTAAGTRYRSE
jgi:chromosome segregation ATPase